MKKIAVTVLILVSFILCGCSRQAVTDKTLGTENTEIAADEGNNTSSAFWENYTKRFYDNRVKISECQEAYDAEAEELKKNPTERFSFASCDFGEIDAQDQISVLRQYPRHISEEESLQAIADWLKEIGMEDLDMDKEVHDASGQFERDEGREYPNDYVTVSEHRSEFEKGDGFFVNTNDCYVQMGGDGIYSMSDGAITRYLKSDAFAAMDALGVNSETVVKEGKLKDLENEEWELLSGKMTVKDAADIAKKYFAAGTPYPCTEGVSVDIPRLSVFSLGDKYGYAFLVRRRYKGIPFAYAENGERQYYGCYMDEDVKTAYVVNDETVCAFTGYSEALPLEAVGEAQDAVISLKEAVSILDEKLAMQVEVEFSDVELAYCSASADSSNEKEAFFFPCWSFDGVNQVDHRGIRLYLDAFTGELYYYTYGIVE